ncbi:tetratricopeptide repeat protein [Rhodobacteraceae bacterium nBUS_22]
MTKVSVAKSLAEAKKLTKVGKIEDAKRVYEEILKAFPGNKRAKEGLALLGKTSSISNNQPAQNEIEHLISLYHQELFSETISKSNLLLEVHSGSVTLWNILGASYLGIGNASQAEASFRRIIDLDPASSEGWYNLGVSLQKQNEPHAAISAYKEATKLDSSYVNAYNNMGLNFKDIGEFKAALEAYDKALELNPKYSEVHYNKGLVFQLNGQLQEALAANLEALSHKPDYVDAYLNIGSIYRALEDYEKAINFYKTAITLEPKFTEAYNNLGNTLGDIGKYEEAVSILSTGVQIDPNNAEIHNNLANIFKNQGKLTAAIKSYERAIDLNPNRADFALNLTNILTIVESPIFTQNIISQCNERIQNLNYNFQQLLNDDQSLKKFLDEIYSILDFFKIDFDTSDSQIFRRNETNFNCSRHMGIFDKHKVIPKFCFSCFKVQISVNYLLDLVKIYLIFDKIKLKYNNTRKCMIEMRPNVDGFFKGLIYCNSLDEAEIICSSLNRSLPNNLSQNYKATVKRGCSEYPIEYPKFKIPTEAESGMMYDESWLKIEEEFDIGNLKGDNVKQFETLPGLFLNDFIILENWGKYAKGLGDESLEAKYFHCEADDPFFAQGLARRQQYQELFI